MYETKPDENNLRKMLKDWGLNWPKETIVAAWSEYKNKGTPPVSGGYLEWPESIRDDFDILDAIMAFHKIQKSKADTPAAGFFDIFKRGKK